MTPSWCPLTSIIAHPIYYLSSIVYYFVSSGGVVPLEDYNIYVINIGLYEDHMQSVFLYSEEADDYLEGYLEDKTHLEPYLNYTSMLILANGQ